MSESVLNELLSAKNVEMVVMKIEIVIFTRKEFRTF